MRSDVSIAYTIRTSINRTVKQLRIPSLSMVVCTHSYSLYECLIKMGSTREKRLVIDFMALQISDERRRIKEVRWINGEDNPADAVKKANSNRTITIYFDTNGLNVRIRGWNYRSSDKTRQPVNNFCS